MFTCSLKKMDHPHTSVLVVLSLLGTPRDIASEAAPMIYMYNLQPHGTRRFSIAVGECSSWSALINRGRATAVVTERPCRIRISFRRKCRLTFDTSTPTLTPLPWLLLLLLLQVYLLFGKTGWLGGKLTILLREQGKTVHLADSRLENRESVLK